MSSDPKKPPFDAPPNSTPDLLQKDMSLDRRRRVPTFEELQARPAPLPQATVPAHPDPMQTVPVPLGIQPRQPAPAQPARAGMPPAAPARAALPPPPPAAQPTRPGQTAPRTAPPTPAEMWSAHQPGQPPARPAPQAPPRAEPPSPVDYARARPSMTPLPQVTPSVPSPGAVLPEGQQSTPSRAQPALKPAAGKRAAPAVSDEPEPRPLPATASPARPFTPSPALLPHPPGTLPAEMLVTQPGLPGPFAQARALPPPSSPEFPQAAPQFEEPLPPEGDRTTVTAEPAALWRRMGAWLTDLLLVGVLVLIFLTIAMTVIAPKNLSPLQQWGAVAMPGAALAAVLAFVYTTLFAFLWKGRTPGRRLMGIHLVDVSGHAPAPARALVRAMLSLVSFALFLSGFWLALFDRHGQTLHDKLTRTFVVKLQDV